MRTTARISAQSVTSKYSLKKLERFVDCACLGTCRKKIEILATRQLVVLESTL